MPNLDLEKKYIDFINQQIINLLPNVEIYIFGSRTQNTALKYSDIDIALKAEDIIDISIILKLKATFQNSTFPFKVDIIDLNAVDKSFFNIIKEDLIKIN